jgi:putative hydrolase of HD superfamily
VHRRMRPIGVASETLGSLSTRLIELAVERGILAPAPVSKADA